MLWLGLYLCVAAALFIGWTAIIRDVLRCGGRDALFAHLAIIGAVSIAWLPAMVGSVIMFAALFTGPHGALELFRRKGA